jgi:hypothetical protein
VEHGALERDDPRAARGQRDVRVHRIHRIEVDEAGLDRADLRVFVQVEQVGEFAADAFVFRGRGGDRLGEVRMVRREAQQRGLVQAVGAALAGMGAERGEGSEQGVRHGGGLNEKLRGWAAQPVNSWVFKRLRESSTPFPAI